MKPFFILSALTLIAPITLAAAPCDSTNARQALACFDRLASCVKIEGQEARLACYRAGGPGSDATDLAATGVATAPVSGAGSLNIQAEIEEAYPVAVGRTEAEAAPVLTAKVVKLDRNAHKYYYLWLDNGHVWREKERARFRYKVGDSITISKGALGANHLRLDGRTGMVLVERVK